MRPRADSSTGSVQSGKPSAPQTVPMADTGDTSKAQGAHVGPSLQPNRPGTGPGQLSPHHTQSRPHPEQGTLPHTSAFSSRRPHPAACLEVPACTRPAQLSLPKPPIWTRLDGLPCFPRACRMCTQCVCRNRAHLNNLQSSKKALSRSAHSALQTRAVTQNHERVRSRLTGQLSCPLF